MFQGRRPCTKERLTGKLHVLAKEGRQPAISHPKLTHVYNTHNNLITYIHVLLCNYTAIQTTRHMEIGFSMGCAFHAEVRLS